MQVLVWLGRENSETWIILGSYLHRNRWTDKKTYSLCMEDRPRGGATCPPVKLVWPPASCICVSIKNLARGPGNHNLLLRQSSGYTCFASSCSSLSFQLISDISHPLESVITSLLPVMVMNANSVQDILMDTIGAPACTR